MGCAGVEGSNWRINSPVTWKQTRVARETFSHHARLRESSWIQNRNAEMRLGQWNIKNIFEQSNQLEMRKRNAAHCLTGDKEPTDGTQKINCWIILHFFFIPKTQQCTKSQQVEEETIINGQPGDGTFSSITVLFSYVFSLLLLADCCAMMKERK